MKLVAEVGVGTIAAGVAKAGADAILISRPRRRHRRLAARVDQACRACRGNSGWPRRSRCSSRNGLRGRVSLQTDGGSRPDATSSMAALLGAEEYGFGTAALVAIGCVMARQCHLNTCPVGIATQDAVLRAKLRRHAGARRRLLLRWSPRKCASCMAELGFRTLRGDGRPRRTADAAQRSRRAGRRRSTSTAASTLPRRRDGRGAPLHDRTPATIGHERARSTTD